MDGDEYHSSLSLKDERNFDVFSRRVKVVRPVSDTFIFESAHERFVERTSSEIRLEETVHTVRPVRPQPGLFLEGKLFSGKWIFLSQHHFVDSTRSLDVQSVLPDLKLERLRLVDKKSRKPVDAVWVLSFRCVPCRRDERKPTISRPKVKRSKKMPDPMMEDLHAYQTQRSQFFKYFCRNESSLHDRKYSLNEFSPTNVQTRLKARHARRKKKLKR